MPTPRQLIDTVTRHQVLLEGLKTGHVNDFNKVFDQIDTAMALILNSLRVDKLDEISRTRLKAILSELQTAQSDALDGAIAKFYDEMPAVAEYEAQFEVKAIQSVLVPGGRVHIVAPVAEEVYTEVLKRPIQATGALLKVLVADWEAITIKRVNNAVALGYAQGKTVPQIIKILQGTGSLRFKDGVTAVNKRMAATVIRTSIQHVAATARELTYEENSNIIEGVLWVSTLDSHTTAICRSLDGQHFPLDEGPRPPVHPNCRSTTAPDISSAFDFLDAGATRSSTDGYVPADTTYYEWLKGQSSEFQDEVLGPVRGQLFREGGLSAQKFSDLQLDKNFQPLTLEQMRSKEPLAFQRAGLTSPF